jgi:hypothetical protein
MTYIAGVIGAALLFGLFTMLRPRDAGCTGHCVGCTLDGACQAKEDRASKEDVRNGE